MNKVALKFLGAFMVIYSTNAFPQIIDTPIVHDLTQINYVMFNVSGRVINMNLKDISEATITNKRTNEKAKTDMMGIFHIGATVRDTLFFEYPKLSTEMRSIKHPKDQINVVMIARKIDHLPLNYSKEEHERAIREDEKFYRILEKDAKLEGRWKY